MKRRCPIELLVVLCVFFFPGVSVAEMTVEEAVVQAETMLSSAMDDEVKKEKTAPLSSGIERTGNTVVFSSSKDEEHATKPVRSAGLDKKALQEAHQAVVGLEHALHDNVPALELWPVVEAYRVACLPLKQDPQFAVVVRQSQEMVELVPKCQHFFGGDWEWGGDNFGKLVLGKNLPRLNIANKRAYRAIIDRYLASMDQAYALETYYRADGTSWTPNSGASSVSALPANDGYLTTRTRVRTAAEFSTLSQLSRKPENRKGYVTDAYRESFLGRDYIFVEKYDTYRPKKMYHRSHYPYDRSPVTSGTMASTELMDLRELMEVEERYAAHPTFFPVDEYLLFLEFRRSYGALYDSWFVWVDESVWPSFMQLEQFFVTTEPYLHISQEAQGADIEFYQRTTQLTQNDDPYKRIKPIDAKGLNE